MTCRAGLQIKKMVCGDLFHEIINRTCCPCSFHSKLAKRSSYYCRGLCRGVCPGLFFSHRYLCETTNTSFATILLPTSMEHDKASNSRCSCRSRRFFSAKHIEDTLIENSPLQAHCSSMPFLRGRPTLFTPTL